MLFVCCSLAGNTHQVVNSAEMTEAQLSRENWHARLNWAASDCPLDSPDDATSGVTVHDWGAGASLVEVACERRAYQGTFLLYFRKGSSVTQLSFEQFESPDIGQLIRYRSPILTGLLLLTTGTGNLEVLRKYRGPGDCGQFLRYHIDGESALLKELRVGECGALPRAESIGPHKWPVRKF
jgi:hypothetical protein